MDGASIYAGASSGSSGVAVNLLACVLARAFPHSEATAIWVELVAQRKRDIEENLDDSQFQSLAARMACRQDLSRDELAKWDASARAWLLSADEVKKFEATQFKLIVKDLGMFASSVGSTYASILDVWTTAMRSLQDLIDGMPQKITKGALLLGISAWHIYPDLNVVGPTAYVGFKDSLVNPGGIITIGLSASENDTGAKWSLSLSHLRYYGDPVTVSMPAGVDISRITMQQLHLVALGSVMGSWGMCGTTAENGAEFFIALKDCLSIEDDIFVEPYLLWLYPLLSAAKSFLGFPQGTQRDEASHLIAYGRRNGQNFLEREEQPREPVFGLAHPLNLAALSTKLAEDEDGDEDADEEQCIEDLRHLASQCRLSNDQCIIRYRRKASQFSDSRYEYATAIPLSRKSQKRDREGTEHAALFHMRWFETDLDLGKELSFGEECHRFDPADIKIASQVSNNLANIRSVPKLSWHNPPRIFLRHSRKFVATGEIRKNPNTVNDEENASLSEDDSTTSDVVVFQMIASNAKNAALFKIANTHVSDPCFLKDVDITKVLRLRKSEPQPFLHFLTPGNTQNSKFRHPNYLALATSFKNMKSSLVALARASKVYDGLPGATVSMNLAQRPLHLARWAIAEDLGGSASNRAAKFACIAMFETGTLDIEPSAVSLVMAMSSGNSIYVANGLLQDPSGDECAEPKGYGVTRILGNLGRPGVVMLVPPQAPRIVAKDPNSWRLINHHRFNGETVDSFTDTSLHLSFTEYEVPLSVPIGAIDAHAVMLESLISVYDRKKWIADLDILGNLENEHECDRLGRQYCRHSGYQSASPAGNIIKLMDIPTKQLVSIDNWDELLDPPERLGETRIGVIRAGSNWQARLATMSVSVQMKHRTVVLSTRGVCESCGVEILKKCKQFAQILIL